MLFDELDVTHQWHVGIISITVVTVLRIERNCTHHIFINLKWLQDC